MSKYKKEELDAMAAEAFAEDELEKNTNIGFDPADVVRGDADAVEKFKKQREAATRDKR